MPAPEFADVGNRFRGQPQAIAPAGDALPPASVVDTAVLPAGGGSTTGDGSFGPASDVTVVATPTPGYRFLNWTENGVVVGTGANHLFNVGDVNHSLVANFAMDDVPTPIEIQHDPAPGVVFSMQWSLAPPGWILEESPDLSPGSWTNSVRTDAPLNGLHHVHIASPAPEKLFFRLRKM